MKNNIKSLVIDISNKIKIKVDKEKKEPTGNQNCLLCTWCAELQLRGIDILPRPVYSPRDIIFKYTDCNIVKYHRKMYFNNFEELISKVKKGKRFYCHINWKDTSGGHEFLLLNINNEIFIMDSQDGLFVSIDSKEGKYYFTNINYSNSFIVRTDNKKLNKSLLTLNDDKYIINFNEEEDLKYL